tara:strand:- start:233 stop:850 length:618 start_codon:yes stop_codon:yes gene_type:complete
MTKPLILDINSGNVMSLKNIINKFNDKVKISNEESELELSTHIFLPGVGSYSEVMNKIKEKINLDLLKKKLLTDKVLFLGICVGMQVLSDIGYENETSNGLSIINGKVKKLNTKENLPHVGWNSLNLKTKNKIFEGIPNQTDFYFTHSYVLELNDTTNEISSTNYGTSFTSAINKQNIFGTQFHPEKSQSAGIKLIKNFLGIEVY